MKTKFKENIKTLFKSSTDTKILFDRRKNSFFAPLIIFILVIAMMILPSYIVSKNKKQDSVIKQFPGINEPLEELLTSSLACKVENKTLVCDEDAEQINMVVGDNIEYTVIANQNSISANLETSIDSKKDTDNLVVLLKKYIRIRYCERDYVKNEIKTYEIIGDYSEFEGYDFREISEKLKNNSDLISSEINNFVYTAYLSTLDTQLLVNLSSALISFLFFVLVSSFILKCPGLFKRKKGFKYSECLKISLTSSLPALLIATLLFFLLGIDFSLAYGFIYVGRIIYIYVKYVLSNKNNIFKELYQITGEERFNI